MNPWEQILAVVANQISKQNFDTWLKPAEFSHHDERTIVVQVANSTMRDWIIENYLDQILAALKALSLPFDDVRFHTVVPSQNTSGFRFAPASAPGTIAPAGDEFGDDSGRTKQLPLFDAGVRKSSPINPLYTFDTLVVGDSNHMAHAAATCVSHHPGAKYNPLFIYGNVGLGKTHLLHAMGNELTAGNSKLDICCVSAERFMNEWIASLRDNAQSSFRRWIRNVDVLLIDDVQMITRGDRVQEEFFHTFNALHESGRQIVLTSDQAPASLGNSEARNRIHARLQSRFESGLICDVTPPSLEMRIAILMRKAEQIHFRLAPEVARYIASAACDNVRMLEGCLLRLQAFQERTQEPDALVFAERILASVLPKPRKLDLRRIEDAVCKHYDLRPGELKSKSQTRRIVQPRQLAIYMARELMQMSPAEIGRAFGNMDRTTILHAQRKVSERISRDPGFCREVQEVRAEVAA